MACMGLKKNREYKLFSRDLCDPGFLLLMLQREVACHAAVKMIQLKKMGDEPWKQIEDTNCAGI